MNLQFLIKAEFKADYDISPNRILLENPSQPVTLRRRAEFPEENEHIDVLVESLTGYLQVTGCRAISCDEWDVECDVADDAKRAVRPLIERLIVREKASGVVKSEIEVVLENRGRIACRPDPVRLLSNNVRPARNYQPMRSL